MAIQESGEMYLENILVLRNKLGYVRAIDIVNHTGYSKPSISRALGVLKKNEMITVDSKGHIYLTEDGEKRAQIIYDRHRYLTAFFMKIGVSEETAGSDACKIEHVISDETIECMKKYIDME